MSYCCIKNSIELYWISHFFCS